jgi:hypothetical protein
MPSAPFRLSKCGHALFLLWARKNLTTEGKNVMYLVPTNTDAGYEHKDHSRREIPNFSNSTQF